jgi:glycosyltransferase involved in cell wall biosynthesis
MNGSSWGGSEELWYRTALLLAHRGANVACAVYDWQEKEERLQALQAAGCSVYRLPNKKTIAARSLKKIYRKLKTKAQLKAAINALPVEAYDIVIVNQGGYEVYTSPWKNVYQRLKNYVLLFHNYNEHQAFSKTQKKALQNWVSNAAMNFFAAQRIIGVLEEKLSIAFSRAAVLINPITFDPPAGAIADPPLQNGNYTLGMFAALDTSRKAQDTLIAVLAAPKWKERNWQLHLYGEGGDRHTLQALINEKGLQEKVFLLGHTADVAGALRQVHLVLQITNIDAMPLSVVEAMAMSRPLVVSRTGDMPQWVANGQNGWVCDPTPADIDATLEKAWQAKDRWEVMGRRSFFLFKQKFPRSPEERFLQQLNETLG